MSRIFYIVILISAICGIRGTLFAQTSQLDSLKLALKSAKHDSSRINTLVLLGHRFKKIDLDSSILFYTQAEKLSKSSKLILKQSEAVRGIGWILFRKGEPDIAMKRLEEALTLAQSDTSNPLTCKRAIVQAADIMGNMAMIHKDHGEFQKAIDLLNHALAMNIKYGNKEGMIVNYGNLGIVYYEHENMSKSLDNYFLALKLAYESNDKQLIMNNLGNIGGVYRNLNDLDKAMEYYEKALKLAEENDNKTSASINLNNIGIAYSLKGNYKKAIEYYNKAMSINEATGRKGGLLFNLSGLGVANFNLRQFDEALKYYKRAAAIAEETDNPAQFGNSLGNIGSVYMARMNFSEAEKYFRKALGIAEKTGYTELQKNEHNNLYELFKKMGRSREALEQFEMSIKLRDSLVNQENVKMGVKKELQFQYEKQAAADSVAHAKESEIKNAELAKQSAEIKAKKNQQYALFGGLGLVMLFAGFMYNRFKMTQKQKSIIEEQKILVETQKHLVEEKQKEILDSIHYARRIQMAQIPSEKRVGVILGKLINK